MHYPSALKEEFFKSFEAVVDGWVSKFNFRETWDTMLKIESNCLKPSVSGQYSLSSNQILNGLEILPPLRYCIDDDIQMSSAPFTPNIAPSKEVQTMSLSPDANMVFEEGTPVRDVRAVSPSTVSSTDWVVCASNQLKS